MNGKLLFLDIDGTLTEPGYNTPPESALKAIKMAQKNNMEELFIGQEIE